MTPDPGILIDRATRADAGELLALMERAHLPTDGLAAHFDTAFVAREGGRVVGSAAIEVYAEGGLLRSVAVDADRRGTGLGERLTVAAIEDAQRRALPALYLLTTTAERFFPRFGFERITRDEVPPSVQASIEFRGACPASATVMRLLFAFLLVCLSSTAARAADPVADLYNKQLDLLEHDLVSLAEAMPGDNGPVTLRTKAAALVYHSYNHYGQMVVYARMNGIVPPASRP